MNENEMKDPFSQLVSVEPNDVIVIKDDSLTGLSDEECDQFMKMIHERFPENLVIIMASEDSFSTQPIGEIRSMLEHLIEHQEAVEKERAK